MIIIVIIVIVIIIIVIIAIVIIIIVIIVIVIIIIVIIVIVKYCYCWCCCHFYFRCLIVTASDAIIFTAIVEYFIIEMFTDLYVPQMIRGTSLVKNIPHNFKIILSKSASSHGLEEVVGHLRKRVVRFFSGVTWSRGGCGAWRQDGVHMQHGSRDTAQLKL